MRKYELFCDMCGKEIKRGTGFLKSYEGIYEIRLRSYQGKGSCIESEVCKDCFNKIESVLKGGK